MTNDSTQDIKNQRFYGLFFGLILGLSIILRIPYLFAERLWPDEALYAWNAKRIFLHPELIFSKEIIDFHPPLFSIILSFAHWVFAPFMACHVTVFLINILGIVAVYLLGRKIQGPFLGCMAAMMLALNRMYFGMSGYILIDGVLTVFVILFLYFLRETPTKENTRQDLWIALAIMAMILLKWSGGIALVFVLFYYLLFLTNLTVRERIRKASVVLMMGGVLVGLLLVLNHAVFGGWIPKVFGHSYDEFQLPFLFYWSQLDLVIRQPLVPFFLVGLYLSLKNNDHRYRVHGVWILFVFFVISAMVNKDNRFMLMFLPSVVLLTGAGIEFLISKFAGARADTLFKPLSLLIVLAGLLYYQYPSFGPYLNANASSYSGYRETGQFVNKFIRDFPDTLVLAGSPRGIRYFSDVNFTEFGGVLMRLPETETELRKIISLAPGGLLLIVDEWEWAQPKWLYPLTNDKIRLLKDMGFTLIYVVNKPAGRADYTTPNTDVIWVFLRPDPNE